MTNMQQESKSLDFRLKQIDKQKRNKRNFILRN